jgi:nitrogen fixation/metabolism regulation signal transduction histidine kinase
MSFRIGPPSFSFATGFSRHRQSNTKEPATITAILDSVVELFETRLANSHIVVERRFQNNARILLPGELRQVFANLIGNALDVSRTGRAPSLRVAQWYALLCPTSKRMSEAALKKLMCALWTRHGREC